MDRSIIYIQEQGRSIDFMFAQRSGLIALGKVVRAMLGTSTWLDGLPCAPTAPASLAVQVGAGQIFSLENVDDTAYGILSADTTHQIMKQGILLDAVTLNTPVPTTSGYSINYLVQVSFQEIDTTNVVLPFFNSAAPSQPFSGQNNNGAALPTERQGACVVSVKAGAAATTGSQATPAPDAGYIGAYVVTVANGQTTVTSGNISAYPNAPFLPTNGVFQGLQNSAANYALDTSATVNIITAALTPAPLALADGMQARIKAANTNTTAVTMNLNGLGSLPVIGAAGALQGGEIVATYDYDLVYSAAAASWLLMGSSRGGVQVGNATKSNHATALGQFPPGASASSAQGVAIGASYNDTLTLSFTAPCKGTLMVFGKINTSSTGSASITVVVAVNGATVSSDSTILSQSHAAAVPLTSGQSAPVTLNVTTTTSPGVTATYSVAYLFIPSV